MKYFSKNKKWMAYLILLTFVFTSIVPAGPVLAEEETGGAENVWYGDELSVDVTAGTEGYTFMSLFREPAHGYEFSGHFMGEGEGPQTFVMIDTAEYGGETWRPNGLYELGKSNYDVLYCCDVETMIVDGAYYKRLNLEDSGYYNKEQAEKIRAIVTNSYPYVSLEDMKANLVSNKVWDAANLTRNEIIAAVQCAIWACANDMDAPLRYSKSYRVADNLGWGYPLHDTSDEPELDVSGNRTFKSYEDVGKRIDAVADYLFNLDGVEASKDSIIISSAEIGTARPVPGTDGLYDVDLKVQLNSGVHNSNDDISITVTSYHLNDDGERVVTGKPMHCKVTGEKSLYEIALQAQEGDTIEVIVEGTQYVPKGAYFYEPEGGRKASQCLVGVAEGETSVYLQKELTFKADKTMLQLKKVDAFGQPLSGAEFVLSQNGNKLATYTLNNKDATVFIPELEAGEYTLTETKAPAGYVLLEKPISLVISKTEAGLQILANGADITDNPVITVKNEKEYEEKDGLEGSKKITDSWSENNRYEITLSVPGVDEETLKLHNEVILMIDGSYSFWGGDAKVTEEDILEGRQKIKAVGKHILDNTGTTSLTLMGYAMSDVLVESDISTLEELNEKVDKMTDQDFMYGVSSTNCEAGFNGIAKYIQNAENLNNAYVIFVSDSGANTSEEPIVWDAWAKHPERYHKEYGSDLQKLLNDFDVTLDEAEGYWDSVYAYSELTRGTAYSISTVEKAWVDYTRYASTQGEEVPIYLFYSAIHGYTPYFIDRGTNQTRGTRATAAADQLANLPQVAALCLVNYGTANEEADNWMNPNSSDKQPHHVTSDKIEYYSSDLKDLGATLENVAQEIVKSKYNDVTVNDYMSKWVNLDPESIQIFDKDECIYEYDESTGGYKWFIDEGIPTSVNPPVEIKLVNEDQYEAGGINVAGNTTGSIYQLIWKVKDGPLLLNDQYQLKYTVTVDTDEDGYEYGKWYPANGLTTLEYTDRNGETVKKEIDVPDVIVNEEGTISVGKETTGNTAPDGPFHFTLYVKEELVNTPLSDTVEQKKRLFADAVSNMDMQVTTGSVYDVFNTTCSSYLFVDNGGATMGITSGSAMELHGAALKPYEAEPVSSDSSLRSQIAAMLLNVYDNLLELLDALYDSVKLDENTTVILNQDDLITALEAGRAYNKAVEAEELWKANYATASAVQIAIGNQVYHAQDLEMQDDEYKLPFWLNAGESLSMKLEATTGSVISYRIAELLDETTSDNYLSTDIYVNGNDNAQDKVRYTEWSQLDGGMAYRFVNNYANSTNTPQEPVHNPPEKQDGNKNDGDTKTPDESIDDPDVPLGDMNLPDEPVIPDEELGDPEIPLGDAPATGDSANAVPFMALLLAAIVGLVITRRKFN